MFTYRSLIRLVALGCCLQSLTAINASQQVDFENVNIQSTAMVVLPTENITIAGHKYYGFTDYAKSLTTHFPTYNDVQIWNDAVMSNRISFDKDLKAPNTETNIPYEWGSSRTYKNFKDFWECNMRQNYFDLRKKWNKNASTKKRILEEGDYAVVVAASEKFKDEDIKNFEQISKRTADGIATLHHNATSNPELYESLRQKKISGTQHLYTRDDLTRKAEGHYQYIHHYPVSYTEYQTANKDKDIFKNVVLQKGEGKVVDGSAIIPERVTNIGAECFYYNSNVRRIAFPIKKPEKTNDPKGILKNNDLITTVREIGKFAFAYCNIQKLSLPIGINRIGSFAFVGNGIDTLSLPWGIVEIGANAFERNAMKSVVFQEGLRKIDGMAFAYCKQLKIVTFPSTIHEIGYDAFHNTQVKDLTFPEGVVELKLECNKTIQNIYLPSTLETLVLSQEFNNQRLNISLKRGNHTQTIKMQLEKQLKNATITIVD